MSAPKPQVRVDGHWYECDGCGVRMMPWGAGVYPEKVGMAAAAHAETCAPLRLARLQARWDARDDALRGLVERWRQRADEAAASSDGDDDAEAVYYHRYACADELERAIGGGE